MASYNIIYKSPGHNHYLWNGTGFDTINDSGRETLRFSGKTYTQDELPNALKKCREAIQHTFPADTDPELQAVEIDVETNRKE